MQSQTLSGLSDRLLRAGVAHRHVRRYIRELRDHYEDALHEELAKGLDRRLAEQAAWARVGSEEELVRSVLAQPALRSTAARFPALVFGAAPVLIWFASLALSLAALGAFFETYEPARLTSWALRSGYALCLVYVRLLPVLLGAVLLIVSARQRTRLFWPIVGTAIVALIGGTTTVHLTLGSTPDVWQLGLNSALLPLIFPSVAALGKPDGFVLAGGVVRAASMLGIAGTLYVIWRTRQSHSSMVIG